jgi:hypothetical protein
MAWARRNSNAGKQGSAFSSGLVNLGYISAKKNNWEIDAGEY